MLRSHGVAASAKNGVRSALIACALLWPARAVANPLLGPRTGGSVFVGPTSAHVTSIFWNPAAAGLMAGFHFLISGAARLDYTSMSRSTIASADGEPSSTGDRSFSPQSAALATPGGFVGLTYDLASNVLTVGLGVHMLDADRPPDLDGGGYHAAGGSFYGAALTGAVSYRVSRSFYAGIGASLIFPRLDLTFLRDSGLESCTATPCDVEDPANAERWDIKTDYGPSVGFNGGTLLRLGDWWVGLAIDFLFLGTIHRDAEVTIERPGGVVLENVPGRVIYELPVMAHLGARRPLFGDWELIANLTYVRTSQQKSYDVRVVGGPTLGVPEWLVRHRGLRDTLAIEAGIEQPPASRLRLGTRARIETSAVPASQVAIDRVDGLKLEVAGGLEVRLSEHVALSANASLFALVPVDAEPSDYSPSAFIQCDAQNHDLNVPACAAVREGRGIPTAAGSYWRAGSELTVGLSYDVW